MQSDKKIVQKQQAIPMKMLFLQEASNQAPEDDAVQHDDELPWEDAHENKLRVWVRVGFIPSALDEIGAGRGPAKA